MWSKKVKLLLCVLIAAVFLAGARQTYACGGFFCQSSPVNQQAERIIFTQNGDGTITTIVQINYTGSAPDFSWILPLPNPITAADVAVPEGADEAFTELHRLTDVQILAPEEPACTRSFTLGASAPVLMESAAEGEVEVFASGEVGPFGFDVIGSEDPTALIDWLRQNNYRVERPMEPLINLYVEERFVFLAMRLLPEETADSIQPVQVTYASDKPMIPLRLTAVAANPNMPVFVWIFADQQAVPENYAHMQIADGEISFNDFGGNNYFQLVSQRADALGGRAFITEYAGPSISARANANGVVTFDPLLNELAQAHPYLTRLYTVISPEEMLSDPVFGYDPQAADVSNVRDLRGMRGLYDCERNRLISFVPSDAIETQAAEGFGVTAAPQSTSNLNVVVTWAVTLLCCTGLLGGAFGLVFLLRRQASQ